MKPLVRRFYVAMEWIAAKCSTIILCQNPEDIETAVKLGICKYNKIKLLGNGVDLSIFDPFKFDDEFKHRKRSEIGVPENAVVVGIIGRLVKEKGYLELFEAMRDIMARNKNVWLVIIGPEEPEKSDRISPDTLAEYNITSQTCWLGDRYDVAELLACCDVYTLPSWREGFPRSAIEAAAMRLPIVTTNVRGCRQVVEDGVNGLLVPLKNIDALTSAIKKLIEDQQVRQKMGQAGYEKARREFDEQNVCRIVLDTYKQLLEKN
jgi:glycosyltransferase involved in cell wall biosynthesis